MTEPGLYGTQPRPLSDVERDILAIGDLEVLVSIAPECKGEHQWRPAEDAAGRRCRSARGSRPIASAASWWNLNSCVF